jgi:hypothetical protein
MEFSRSLYVDYIQIFLDIKLTNLSTDIVKKVVYLKIRLLINATVC